MFINPHWMKLELLDEFFVGGGFFFWKMFILDNQKILREN